MTDSERESEHRHLRWAPVAKVNKAWQVICVPLDGSRCEEVQEVTEEEWRRLGERCEHERAEPSLEERIARMMAAMLASGERRYGLRRAEAGEHSIPLMETDAEYAARLESAGLASLRGPRP